MKQSTHSNKIGEDPLQLLKNGNTRRGRWVWWVVLLVLAGGAAVLWAATRSGGSSGEIGYLTEPARRGDLTVTVSATGNLEPTNQVDVGSEISGTVKEVRVAENDHVSVGQVLAILDTAKLEAQVMQSKASVASARAKVSQAEATEVEAHSKFSRLERVRALGGDKAVSPYDLDAAGAALARAEADLLSAHAAVEQARAVLKVQETDLAKAVIRSPINGIVLTRSVEPGQTVAASLQAPVLFTLAQDLASMELHVDVDEADVGQVKQDQPATFTVDAYPERTFQAKIISVHYGSKITDNVVTYETILAVDNADLSLRPGMTATADIIVQQVAGGLLVPNTAIRFTPPRPEGQSRGRRGLIGALLPRPPHRNRSGNKTSFSNGSRRRVWVLVDGRPKPVRITTGSTDGVRTEVTGGDLTEGTPVIVGTERVSS